MRLALLVELANVDNRVDDHASIAKILWRLIARWSAVQGPKLTWAMFLLPRLVMGGNGAGWPSESRKSIRGVVLVGLEPKW